MNLDIENHRVKQVVAKFFGLEDRVPVPTMVTGSNPPVFVKSDITLQMLTEELLGEFADVGLILAGGAVLSIITGQNVNDLDFYMKDRQREAEVLLLLKKYFPGAGYVSRNAITMKRKSSRSNKVWSIQLILRFAGPVHHIFETFDFTITQGAYDFCTKSFEFGERFMQDVAAKKLVYLGGSRYPICAMYRTKKYGERGYAVPGSTIMHIALSIVRLDIKTYGELKDQLMGIDTCYLQGLLAGEDYKDDLPIDYGKFLVEAFQAFNGVPQDATNFAMLWAEDATE